MISTQLQNAIRCHADETGKAPATITRLIVGSAHILPRLEKGGSVSIDVAERLLRSMGKKLVIVPETFEHKDDAA